MRDLFFVLLADGARGSAAQSQPRAQQCMYREEANRQREGKPKGSREEVAHARTRVSRTPAHEEEFLQQPATERTVKVHQSGQQSFGLLRQSVRRVSRQDDGNMPGVFVYYAKAYGSARGIVYTPKRAVGDPAEP